MNIPWRNGQHTTFGIETFRVRFLWGTFFFGMLIFFPARNACSPGQIFTWMLNHQCGEQCSTVWERFAARDSSI